MPTSIGVGTFFRVGGSSVEQGVDESAATHWLRLGYVRLEFTNVVNIIYIVAHSRLGPPGS